MSAPVPLVGRPLVVLAVMSGALFVVARTTGSGWLVVLLSGLLATVVLGLALPLVALPRVRVAVRAPSDGTVGRDLRLDVTVAGRGRGLRLRVVGPDGPEVSVDAPVTGPLTIVPRRREVVRALTIELRSAGPLGLVAWRRRLTVELPRPLEVGPHPIEVGGHHPDGSGGNGARQTVGGHEAEVVRSAREYVRGDPLRLLHWPATARTGTLMVRELEAPANRRLIVVVDLRGPEGPADDAAGRAAGLALAALGEGALVTLVTAERDGPAIAAVASPIEVGRRLARAVATPPPDPPADPGATVVRIVPQDRRRS